LQTESVEWQGRTHSIIVNLPPLAVVAFKREAPSTTDAEEVIVEQSGKTKA
jgi:hypothetical protein